MKETRLIDDERITTFGRLLETHALLARRLDDDLQKAVGMPLLWYGVLLLIGRSPNGPLPMRELLSATAFTTGGVTRLVDRMEQAGYVRRRPCPYDRRVTYVEMTDRGHEALERATPVHLQGIQAQMLDPLQPGEVAQLEAILDKIRAAQGGQSAPGAGSG